MKVFIISLLFLSVLTHAQAQVRVYDPRRTTERSVENRANRKVDQGINRGLDKVEEGIIGIFKKKDKPKAAPAKGAGDQTSPENTDPDEAADTGRPAADNPASGRPGTLKSYGKFDFVPGEKIVAFEDFMQDAVGDFPDKWNSTGTGEIVTLEGRPGHWLMLNKQGTYLPEFIKSLPENVTLQFDLACNEKFSFYSSYLWINLVAMTNPAKEFANWGRFPKPNEGVRVGLHPQGAGNGLTGMTEFITYAKGDELLKNRTDQHMFSGKASNVVKISMWRQKQRLRVYIDEQKIWDVPRAFQPDVTYNGLVVSMGDMHQADDRYFVSNIRLAVGAPDTRNKLLTEGKFVTRGILFDSNADQIKPESYGTLKDIAAVLTENPDLRVQIVGHTDSDGDDASNLALSKKRATAIKNALSTTFGVDAGRLETDGKGESQPAGPNTTTEGKANNRRVEFVKL